MSNVQRIPTITDSDIEALVALLQRYPNTGATREQLAERFGSDRKARKVIEVTVERGIAAVICVEASYGSGNTYRLAQTTEEVHREMQKLESYERSLRARREGLARAFEAGGVALPQKGLF